MIFVHFLRSCFESSVLLEWKWPQTLVKANRACINVKLHNWDWTPAAKCHLQHPIMRLERPIQLRFDCLAFWMPVAASGLFKITPLNY